MKKTGGQKSRWTVPLALIRLEIPADSKGVADVGLLIPTPQCPSFRTVKNGKNA